jgi:hypothetical protein
MTVDDTTTAPPLSRGRRRAAGTGPAQWLTVAGMATVSMTGVRIAGWTASDMLFFAATMVIAIQLLMGARRDLAPAAARRSAPGILIGLIIFSVGALLATVGRSLDPAGSALVLTRIWYITIVWFWTVRAATNSVRTFRQLLLAALAGTVVNAGIGVLQDVTGANAVAPTWGRSVGLSDHFNDLGLSVGSMIPLVVTWRKVGADHARWDLRRALALLILLGGLGASGSISATGAALVGTLVAVLAPRIVDPSRRRRRSVAPLLLIGVAVLLIAGGIVNLSVFDRISDLTAGSTPTTQSADSRAQQSEVAFARIIESPFLGVGLDLKSGVVDYEAGNRNKVHNFYVRVAYEAGVFGLIGIALILFMVYRQALQLLRVTRGSPSAWLPTGLLGSLTMVLTAAVVGAVQYGRTFWLPMALVSALYGLARTGRLDDDEPSAGPLVNSALPAGR